jgi:hypothetical protein
MSWRHFSTGFLLSGSSFFAASVTLKPPLISLKHQTPISGLFI